MTHTLWYIFAFFRQYAVSIKSKVIAIYWSLDSREHFCEEFSEDVTDIGTSIVLHPPTHLPQSVVFWKMVSLKVRGSSHARSRRGHGWMSPRQGKMSLTMRKMYQNICHFYPTGDVHPRSLRLREWLFPHDFLNHFSKSCKYDVLGWANG